jgi:type I restriction enzyme S subunit
MTWEVKKLGDVCDLMTGGTPSRSKKEYFENGKINWLVSGDVNMKNITRCDGKITEEGLKNSNAKFLPVNSVIIALNGQGKTRGTVAMLKIKATCNQSLVSIYPKNPEIVLPEYIFKNLDSRYEEIRKITGDSGNDRRGLNMPLLRNIDIPIPPLPIQKKIVAILDEAFEKLSKAKENAEANLNNAKEVFESYLQNVFENKGEGWEEKKLSIICEIKGGGTPSKANKSYWNGTIPWVSPKDMKQKDISDAQDHISQTALDNSATNLVPEGSLLIVVRSGILAHTIPLGITRNLVTINQDMKALTPSKELDIEYLYYHLCGIHNKLLTIASRGATVHRIPAKLLENTTIYYSSISEQKAIVKEINSLSSKTKSLESLYSQKLSALEELKQSILQKAFKGELTEVSV